MSELSETYHNYAIEDRKPRCNHVRLNYHSLSDLSDTDLLICELEARTAGLGFNRIARLQRTKGYPTLVEIEHLKTRGYIIGPLHMPEEKKLLVIAYHPQNKNFLVYNSKQEHFEQVRPGAETYLQKRVARYFSGREELFVDVF